MFPSACHHSGCSSVISELLVGLFKADNNIGRISKWGRMFIHARQYCCLFLKNFMETIPSGFDPRIKDVGFQTVGHMRACFCDSYWQSSNADD